MKKVKSPDRTAMVSKERLRKAASAMRGRWMTPFDIASVVMRKSIRVSGNRIVKKMLKLGLAVGRPTGARYGHYDEMEYTLTPEGEGVLG